MYRRVKERSGFLTPELLSGAATSSPPFALDTPRGCSRDRYTRTIHCWETMLTCEYFCSSLIHNLTLPQIRRSGYVDAVHWVGGGALWLAWSSFLRPHGSGDPCCALNINDIRYSRPNRSTSAGKSTLPKKSLLSSAGFSQDSGRSER